MKKNNGIQVLRALAALLVVYAHSIDVVEIHQSPRQIHFYSLENFGACGVDIFFAISGFILSSVILHAKPETPRKALDFVLRRYIRIFPIYWIVSLFPLAFAARHHLLTIGRVISSYLLLPTWRYPLSDSLLSVGWTLLFEMFFYYVLSFNLFFGHKGAVQRSILCILAFVGIGSIVGFHHPLLILIANPINIEFVLGCCIALIYFKLATRPALGTALIALGAAALAMTIIFGYKRADNAALVLNGQLSWYRIMRWGLPAATLTAGVIFHPGEIRSAFGKLWVYLGDASYSIYLTSVVTLFFYNRFYRFVARVPADLNIFLALSIVTLAGAATYSWIEHPITQSITRKYQKSKSPAVSYAAN